MKIETATKHRKEMLREAIDYVKTMEEPVNVTIGGVIIKKFSQMK